MLVFLKAPFLVLHFSYYTLMTFLMMLSVILPSMLMILLFILIILVSIAIRHLWQQPELASELESDLRDTVEWSRKWLVDFSAGKTQLILFDWSNNAASVDVKLDCSVVEEKSSFKRLGLTFPYRLDSGPYIIAVAQIPPRKLESWFVLWIFFLLRLLCISVNIPYGYAWNMVVMSGLVLLVATCNC